MTAHDILNTYDARRDEILASRAAERDALLLDIDTASAALSALRARLDTLDTLTRLDIDQARGEVYRECYVKLDADGCPVPRPGPPVGTVRRKGGAVESPTPPATTEAPASLTGDPEADAALATAADKFMAAISDDRTPEQVRLVLADLDWAVDEMSQYSETALAYAAQHGLGAYAVAPTDMSKGGMMIVATGVVIP